MALRTFQPKPEHDAFMKALKAQIPPTMASQEILAISSQFVGQLIAFQDQTIMSPDQALQIVQANIEIGNQAALMTMDKPEGTA